MPEVVCFLILKGSELFFGRVTGWGSRGGSTPVSPNTRPRRHQPSATPPALAFDGAAGDAAFVHAEQELGGAAAERHLLRLAERGSVKVERRSGSRGARPKIQSPQKGEATPKKVKQKNKQVTQKRRTKKRSKLQQKMPSPEMTPRLGLELGRTVRKTMTFGWWKGGKPLIKSRPKSGNAKGGSTCFFVSVAGGKGEYRTPERRTMFAVNASCIWTMFHRQVARLCAETMLACKKYSNHHMSEK